MRISAEFVLRVPAGATQPLGCTVLLGAGHVLDPHPQRHSTPFYASLREEPLRLVPKSGLVAESAAAGAGAARKVAGRSCTRAWPQP